MTMRLRKRALVNIVCLNCFNKAMNYTFFAKNKSCNAINNRDSPITVLLQCLLACWKPQNNSYVLGLWGEARGGWKWEGLSTAKADSKPTEQMRSVFWAQKHEEVRNKTSEYWAETFRMPLSHGFNEYLQTGITSHFENKHLSPSSCNSNQEKYILPQKQQRLTLIVSLCFKK